MKRILVAAIIIAFISDVIYKNFFEKKNIQKIDKKVEPITKKITQNNNTNVNNTKTNTTIHYINDEDDDDDEFEGVLERENPTINMKIIYDQSAFGAIHDNITSYIKGNYSKIIINSEEYELEFKYYIASKVLFGSQIAFSLFVFAFNSLKPYLPLPEKVISILGATKMVWGGLSFFLHQYLIKKVSHSYAFEVFVKDKLIYSALQTTKPPTYEDIVLLLSNMHIYRN